MWIGLGALLFANFLSGAINPTFVKLGVNEIPPLTFTALRFIIASILFFPIYLMTKPKNITRADFKTLSMYSIFFVLNVGFFSYGIKYTTAIMSQFLYSAVPAIVGVLAHFILGEKFTRNKILGGVIAFIGIIFLLGQSVIHEQTFSLGTPIGNLLIIFGVFSFSLYLTFSKKLTEVYSPFTTSFFSFLLTSILMIALVPIELTFQPLILDNITSTGIVSVILVSVGGTAIMYSLKQVGIARTTAFIASLFYYLAPLFSSLTAIPILGERVTFNLIIGGVLILIGVFYATAYDLAKKQLFAIMR